MSHVTYSNLSAFSVPDLVNRIEMVGSQTLKMKSVHTGGGMEMLEGRIQKLLATMRENQKIISALQQEDQATDHKIKKLSDYIMWYEYLKINGFEGKSI